MAILAMTAHGGDARAPVLFGAIPAQQLGSSSHWKRSITDVGECVTRGGSGTAILAMTAHGRVRFQVRFQVRFLSDHRTPETGDASATAGRMPALRSLVIWTCAKRFGVR